MESRFGNKNHIAAIQEEYRRVDGKWLRMQYQLMLWLVAFATLVEIVMFFVLQSFGMVFTSNEQYLLKYILVPFAGNALMALTATVVVRSESVSEWKKIYTVSLLLAVMAYWIYSIHLVFPIVAMVFLIPMLLTVVYADQKLTAIIAALCIFGKAIADLVPFWVPARSEDLRNAADKVDFGLSLAILIIFYGICAFMIIAEREKNDAAIRLEQERQRYQREALTDQLTQVWNRQALRQKFEQMSRDVSGKRYFLAMMDLDDFKELNDAYGHSQGDRYLRALGQVLRDLENRQIMPFRFGGDEFCVVFSDSNLEYVRETCRVIQERYAKTDINQGKMLLSISIGIAEFQPKEAPAQLLDRADKALYQAKQNKGSICVKTE